MPSTIHLRAAEEKQNDFCRCIFTNKVTLWTASYSACVLYTKTIIHLSVGESGEYFTSEQPKKNKVIFVAVLSQIKLLFGPLVIQLVWYILKQLFAARQISATIHLHFGE